MSTTAPTQIEGNYTLDPVHSQIGFAVKHMVVATFRSQFEDVSATLRDGRLEGSARVASLATKDENLAAHLTAPDFFDAERHPEITFASSALERNGDELVLRGELTIKGITQPIEARGSISGPLEDPFGNTKLGISVETTVDRTAFGLDWNAPLPSGGFALGNDVKLQIELELLREG